MAAVLACGIMLWFGHQVNHDLGVLIGLSGALWCLSRYKATRRRSRLMWAGLSAAGAVLSAYASGFMLVPLALLVLVVVGFRNWRRAIPFFAAAGVTIGGFAALYVDQLLTLRTELNRITPAFATPTAKVAVQVGLPLVVPVLLALLGFRRSGLPAAYKIVAFAGLFVLPAIHVINGVEQAGIRHAAYGIPLAAPLLGAGLHRLVQSASATRASSWRVVVAAAVLVPGGLAQAAVLDRDWVDATKTLDYLGANVEPGDTILTELQWPAAYHLLQHGNLSDPWAIYSLPRIQFEGTAPDFCSMDWFVHDSSAPEATALLEEVEKCGNFEPVFTQSASRTRLESDFRYRTRQFDLVVWRNAGTD